MASNFLNTIRTATLGAVWASLAPVPGAGATVVHVPADVARVSVALNNASSGDTILVAPGTYSFATNGEAFPLVFDTEGVWLQGSGADACTLDAAGLGMVVYILGITNGRLSGFTITGGAGYNGGGLRIDGGQPEIDHNVFLGNGALNQGSGIYVEAGSPWIHHNVVWESFDRDLDDPGDPHGIQVVTGTATIEHNLVGRGDSNGLLTANTSDPVVRNNIFLENGIPGVRGRGICAFGGPNGVIEHNLFQGNALAALLINVSGSTQNHTAEEANDGSPGDNVYGNRDGDPLLADPDALDWALTIMSPAIDAGLPASSPDPDGTIADIGPFFFDQSVTGTEPPPRHLGLLAVPNPFVAATSLRFVLNESSPVRLEVFDVRGRLVSRVAAGVFPAGEHRITWDGRSVLGVVAGPGVYLVRLTTGLRPSVFRIVRTP